MSFFSNRHVNRLTLHSLFSGLAWCLCGVFSTAYLLRNGVLPAQIFLAWSAILVLRLIFIAPDCSICGAALWPSIGFRTRHFYVRAAIPVPAHGPRNWNRPCAILRGYGAEPSILL